MAYAFPILSMTRAFSGSSSVPESSSTLSPTGKCVFTHPTKLSIADGFEPPVCPNPAITRRLSTSSSTCSKMISLERGAWIAAFRIP